MLETVVKERPILMSTPMVKAILAGQKTMTRRVVKLRKGDTVGNISQGDKILEYIICDKDGDEVPLEFVCPYGSVGDKLWVKETYLPDPPRNGEWRDIEFDGCGMPLNLIPEQYRNPSFCLYKASWVGDLRWKPSIFMPRWASRLTLEITDVRIQRIQEITQEDAVKEGITQQLATHLGISVSPSIEEFEAIQAKRVFIELWESLNKKRGYGYFDVNPHVFAISFKAVK